VPTAFEPLDLAQLAHLEQVVLGLRDDADALPGDGDVTYLDEEGTPIAHRIGGSVEAVRPTRWPRPDGSLGPVVVAVAGEVPATAPLPPGSALLLPVGGVRPDDTRTLRWESAWRAAAAGGVIVPVPVPPGEAAGVAGRLASAYGDGRVLTVETVPQPRGAGRTLLFTGLSGSGKSTIARALVERMSTDEAIGIGSDRSVTLLDGDVVRTHLSRGLGFSREDRDINIRRIGWVAAEITKHGGLTVCAPIAPYDETRKWVRSTVDAAGGPGSFLLVWVSTPLSVCEARDVKGLYAKARRGELSGMTGIDDPYEEPADADLVIDTSAVALADAVDQVLALLTSR